MLLRLMGALRGDVATFEEVEHDESATVQAGLIVAIAALLGGLGSGIAAGIEDGGATFGEAFIATLIVTIIGWVIWAALTHFIGSSFFGAQSSIGEMLRVIGFAHVVLWLTIVPIVGLIASIWFLWVVFKAIRAGLDIDTGPTLLVIVIGFFIRLVIAAIAL